MFLKKKNFSLLKSLKLLFELMPNIITFSFSIQLFSKIHVLDAKTLKKKSSQCFIIRKTQIYKANVLTFSCNLIFTSSSPYYFKTVESHGVSFSCVKNTILLLSCKIFINSPMICQSVVMFCLVPICLQFSYMSV